MAAASTSDDADSSSSRTPAGSATGRAGATLRRARAGGVLVIGRRRSAGTGGSERGSTRSGRHGRGAASSTGLELREPRLHFGLRVEVVESLELGIQGRRSQLRLPLDPGLLAPDLVFEPADLTGRVEYVDALHRVVDLGLGLGRLRACDQLVALAGQLVQLVLHRREARLQLLDDIPLGSQVRLGRLDLVLRG